MYRIQLSQIGDNQVSRIFTTDAKTLRKAECVACQACGYILGNTIGFLCKLNKTNYIMKIDNVIKGFVKIEGVKRTPKRGGQSQ